MWTYSYLAVLLPVFLLTDWLRYKPVIMFQSLALLGTMAMLLWAQGVAAMQAMQFCYGVATACEVAYFSYLYSVVELKFYLRATSFCRSAQLVGYTLGAVAGQLFLSLHLLSYRHMLVLTMALVSVAMLAAILLPMPAGSMFFHRREQEEPDGTGEGQEDTNKTTGTLSEETGELDILYVTLNSSAAQGCPKWSKCVAKFIQDLLIVR